MFIPSKGYVFNNPSNFTDLTMRGKVLWGRDSQGFKYPIDLGGRLCRPDMETLNDLNTYMDAHRKSQDVFSYLSELSFEEPNLILPYLKATFSKRLYASELRSENIWDHLWS